MPIRFRALSFTAFLLLSAALPAQAQMATERIMQSRIDNLERQIGDLQRDGGGSFDNAAPVGNGSTAALGNRIAGLEEQIRTLQGKVEEANYRSQQLEAQMKQQQQDVDMRLRDLEQKGPGAPAAAVAAPAAAATAVPAATEASDAAANPNDQYNQAFRLLNQSKYDEAYAAFKQFVTQHPKDALVGNAYYWMGETFYVRRDYVKSADQFRQGFEAAPKGPKAGDNLLKLAMSLSALNRNTEACVVLHQVAKEYAAKSGAVVGKANNEMARIGCK